jgi:DNA-binding MarR family transcriptional regulator
VSSSSHGRIKALDRVLELGVLIERDQADTLAQMGLTASRAHAVWILGHGGPSTHRELADALGVVPRTVTDLVDALEGLGLVTREPAPTDRRASVVALTGDGRALVTRLKRDQRRFADALFGDLSPAELATFVVSMDRVLTTLRPLVLGGQP